MNKKPIKFLIFKIIGVAGLVVAFVGGFKSCNGFGDFETNDFMVGGIMLTFGLFVGISCLVTGFMPAITKATAKTARYIQQENKEVLKDIMTTNAEIASEAVKTTAKAVKDGIKDTMYCKYCGKEIDADSLFCKECGNKLN